MVVALVDALLDETATRVHLTMPPRFPDERHGTYWRNQYGSYFHGKWVPMKYECLGCLFWAVVGFIAFMWIVTVAIPHLSS